MAAISKLLATGLFLLVVMASGLVLLQNMSLALSPSIHGVRNPWDVIDLDKLAASAHQEKRANLAKCIASVTKTFTPDEVWISSGAPKLKEDYPSTAFLYNAGKLFRDMGNVPSDCSNFQGMIKEEFKEDVPLNQLKLAVIVGEKNNNRRYFGVSMYAVPNSPCGMYLYWLERHEYRMQVFPKISPLPDRPFVKSCK